MNKTTHVKHKSGVKYTLDDTIQTNYNSDRKKYIQTQRD